MKFLCIVNRQPVESFIHVSSVVYDLKSLRLSFWVNQGLEPRISQLVSDIARSYDIKHVGKLQDAVVAKSPGCSLIRTELNYSLLDSIEKIDNLLLKIGLIYK